MKKFNQITEFNKKLLKIDKMENALQLIADEAKDLLDAQRCSIFIVDQEDKILWSKVSDGIGRIVIGIDSGIVGATYETKKPQIINSPYKDKRFLSNIDKKSGYITKNIITVPVFDTERNVIGIIELLNKKEKDFDNKDLDVLTFFANYISDSLETLLLNQNI